MRGGPCRARPMRWAAFAVALPVALSLSLGGCQRWWPGRKGQPAAIAQRPFPELGQLSAVVADVRAILPSVPLGVKPVSLGAQPAVPPPQPRLVLEGTARLLRPAEFPAMPPRLQMDVYLDDRTPPGGYLGVTDARGHARWHILDSVQNGQRSGAFAITLRLSDDRAHLRYLVLLGVPFQTGDQHYRSLEGYLIQPGADGTLFTSGPVYAVDFGYGHPEPPPPVVAARALGKRLQLLGAATARLQADAAALAKLQGEAHKLASTPVPADQTARQRKDVARYDRRVAAAGRDVTQDRDALRQALLAYESERVQLTKAWIAYTADNDYRWHDAAGKRADYAPLQALGQHASVLDSAYRLLHGNDDPALRSAREALHQALEREAVHAPPPAG